MADTAAIAAMEKTRDIPENGRITVGDVFGALSKGLDDYRFQPSHYAIAILIYPVIGMLPLLVGLIIVLPILGHATWHLYRALVPAS